MVIKIKYRRYLYQNTIDKFVYFIAFQENGIIHTDKRDGKQK